MEQPKSPVLATLHNTSACPRLLCFGVTEYNKFVVTLLYNFQLQALRRASPPPTPNLNPDLVIKTVVCSTECCFETHRSASNNARLSPASPHAAPWPCTSAPSFRRMAATPAVGVRPALRDPARPVALALVLRSEVPGRTPGGADVLALEYVLRV